MSNTIFSVTKLFGVRGIFGVFLTVSAFILIGSVNAQSEPEREFCAEEGESIAIDGLTEVRYGTGDTFFTAIVTGDIACDNAQFGDPIEGSLKHCDCRSVASCGDGIPFNTEGEECDDGNDINNDGCSTSCEIDIIIEVCTGTLVTQHEVFAYDHSLDSFALLTSINLVVGDHLTIVANSTQTRSAGPDDRTSNADGLISGNIYGGDYGLYFDPVSTQSFPYGSLVGRIFGSDYFLIGTYFSGSVTDSGVLELTYWDSNFEDNTGSILVMSYVDQEVACTISFCGDGVVDDGEQCDDGNENNSDSCTNACLTSSSGGGGGGGQASSIPPGGGTTTSVLLDTGGGGGGGGGGGSSTPTTPTNPTPIGPTDMDSVTSTPLTFGVPIAFNTATPFQLPVVLAATGATAKSSGLWSMIFLMSCVGLGLLGGSGFFFARQQ